MTRIVVAMTKPEAPGSAADQQFLIAMKRGRRERNLSQTELANELKKRGWEGTVRQAIISRIELGEREVRLGEAYLIAQVLAMSVEAMAAPDEVHLLLRDLDSDTERVRTQAGTVTASKNILSRYVDHLRANRARAQTFTEDRAGAPHVESIRRAIDSADEESLLEASKVGR